MTGRQGRFVVRRFGAGIVRHLPLVVLGLSISVNVLLASRLLKAQQPAAPKLNVGALAQPFVGKSAAGKEVRVDYQGAMPTILYYFSPSCGWCERNWANVRALTEQTRGRYRFVGIATTSVTSDFLRQHHLDFEVAADLSPAVAKAYGLGGTPQTILVSADAQVMQNWVGAYVGTQAKDVETYFGLRLPGLVTPPRPTTANTATPATAPASRP